MNLTQEEELVIAQMRADEAKQNRTLDSNGELHRGMDVLGQSLQHTVQALIDSPNKDVSKYGLNVGQALAERYSSWDEITEQVGDVSAFLQQVKGLVQLDDRLAPVAEMLGSAVADAGLSNADFKAMDDASRNSYQEEDVWQRRTSNVDGKTYVVNSDTREYYSEEDWESNNNREVQPDSLGWDSGEGVESSTFNESLPSK